MCFLIENSSCVCDRNIVEMPPKNVLKILHMKKNQIFDITCVVGSGGGGGGDWLYAVC